MCVLRNALKHLENYAKVTHVPMLDNIPFVQLLRPKPEPDHRFVCETTDFSLLPAWP